MVAQISHELENLLLSRVSPQHFDSRMVKVVRAVLYVFFFIEKVEVWILLYLLATFLHVLSISQYMLY